MASITVDPAPPPPERLSLESIPTVDLRLLSQSELTALSLCSSHAFDLRRCDDVVIPKIDRSVFNESAGSRKQTYSRLRLAPRKPDFSTPIPKSRTPAPNEPLDSERAENSRIIALFKHLFDSPGSDSLVPVNVEYSDALPVGPSNVTVPIPVIGGGGERKKKRGRKPKSETMALALALVEKREMLVKDKEKNNKVDEEEEKRKKEEREKELVNKNGVVVDLVELAKLDDPYGPELKRRTEGRETPEELLGFMSDLKGQWGSRRKKCKIVDANEFGDALPNGWKVLIGMKKKQGLAWLFCRRYVSPSGRYFVSCKEVSSYLLSLTSPRDVKQHDTVQCTEDSVVDNKWSSGNVGDVREKTDGPRPPSHDASQSIDAENQQKQICTAITIYQEKLVQPGEVEVASALKCHKCSTPFNEKDELLNHLVSCHKRKRRKAGAPIEDDIMMKDGEYECQFCNKMFHERNSYFGHVGIHVKNYVKSIGGAHLVTAKQNTYDPVSTAGGPVTLSEMVGSVEVNIDSVAGTPDILASGERNISSVNSKEKVVASDAETHAENCNNDRGIMPLQAELNIEAPQNDKTSADDQGSMSVHAKLNMEVAQSDKASTDEPSDKQDGFVHTAVDEVRQADEPADVSSVKNVFFLDSYKMLSTNENSNLCGVSGQITASECHGISPPMMVGNVDECLFVDSNQVDVRKHGNVSPGSDMEYEGVATENGLPSDNGEKSLSKQNFEDRSRGINTVDRSCYDELVKVGDNDELMVGIGSVHLDHDNDTKDVDRHTGSLKECSAVSHEVEEPCGITDNEIDMESIADSKVERASETSSSAPSGDRNTIATQSYVGEVFTGMINETEVDLSSLGNAEMTVDSDDRIAEERRSECSAPVSKDNDPSDIINDSMKVPVVTMLEPHRSGGFQAQQTCCLDNSAGEVSNRVSEEPKSDQVKDSCNLFFTSRSSDTPMHTKVMAEQGEISAVCSPIHSQTGKARSDTSSIFGTYNSFVEDKQDRNAKSILSGLSIDEQMHEVRIKNVTTVSAPTTTTQLPEFHKVEKSQSDKLILDFGSMADMNARFLNTVQHETVPEGSSPFSLWGDQTCVEDNQARVYGDGGGVAQQERASDNTSLSFIGLQQPCDARYNLNKVCMNEQRYGVQHNETGIYIRNSEAERDGISHGNTINLSGLQQQCDARYNLNKPCQQSFGLQHNETGAYSGSDEAQRERVACGNSLSLASVGQTCDTGYSLNKACIQQTCDNGYSVNKGYIGTIQGLSKLDGVQQSRDRDLVDGFGNSGSRPNQGVATDFMWRPTEGNLLPGTLVDSSSSQGQSSGSFQAFDFLSDKGGNGLFTSNEKFDSMSSFEGLRSTSVEPMEFSFLTTQDSNTQLEDPKVLSYNSEMEQGFGSSVWHQKGASMPNMMAGHVVSTLCVWCGNEFHQDSIGCEMQSGSIGYLCPTCKARMAGQFL